MLKVLGHVLLKLGEPNNMRRGGGWYLFETKLRLARY